jgi:CheY-like chemotaxis protein
VASRQGRRQGDPNVVAEGAARKAKLLDTQIFRDSLLNTTAGRSSSCRVLVVDDNVASAQSLAQVLKLEGYDVQVAHDGAVVIEAARRFRPEVVLMDIGLPGVDGYELARRLRQEQDLRTGIALLVAVTGHAEDEARRRSHEAGFDHHLVKPIDLDALLALLSSREWAETTAEERDLATDEHG